MFFGKENLGLYTDFYELSMAQGYFLSNKGNEPVCFDYFFRTNPFKGGFTVFAGLQDFLSFLNKYKFSKSDIDYLKSLDFKHNFLTYLQNFSFKGNIFSMLEGEIVFPSEPILRVEGNIIECQLIESLLLNILNFESLIASKAFRIKLSAGTKPFTDFGLRRAQGFGSIHATRAAIIGGASSTSNALAGKLFNIPVSGTQAHSWIQSFDSELEAFEIYAKNNPENCILLVDTYNTLESGIPNAIKIAKQMESKGQELNGIRLDSGDLAYLSKKARKAFDNAGLPYVKVYASNQLNEFVIKSLLKDQNAAIDAFGVGTELITGKEDAALDGVYKLSEIKGLPKMKFSENIEKVTLPGKKEVYRCFDSEGNFYRDAIICTDENINDVDVIYHPIYPNKFTPIKNLTFEKLFHQVIKNGELIQETKTPKEINNYLKKRSLLLPVEHKRFISPHIYKVGISNKLMTTRNSISKKTQNTLNLE